MAEQEEKIISEGDPVNERHPKKKPDFDDLFLMVGGFGRCSILLYSFMCAMSIPIGCQLLAQVFYGATPKFHCISAIAIPSNISCAVGKCCSNCTGYEFRDVFSSVVSEWNLICDKSHLKAMTQAVYMAGVLVGSVAVGHISDRFGRRVSVFLSIAMLAVFGTSSAWADCLSLFAFLRFWAGVATAGCLLARFVYCMELSLTSNKTAVGFVNNTFIAVGFTALSLFAYLIRDWRYLVTALSIINAPLLLFWNWIPESPRWLVAKDRLDEAQVVMETFARINRVRVDPRALRELIEEVKRAEPKRAKGNQQYGLMDLVRTSKLRKRTVICCFSWFVNALVFFGINLSLKNMAGNMYLNFFILCIIEFPSQLGCWFLMKKYGRRLPYCSYMFLCGVACVLVLAVPDEKGNQPIVTGMAIVGKFFVATTFVGIYVFTAELYPTLIRNMAVGISSMSARVGGIIAPYVVLLADLPNLDRSLPLIIFGISGIAAGLSALGLPETLFTPMPQTVEEAEAWDEDYSLPCMAKRNSERQSNNEMVALSESTQDMS